MLTQQRGPRISVCIACFNEGPDLEATIAMVRASKYQPYEIIVSDDCSEECPRARVEAFDGVKFITHTKRLGSGGNKQAAMDAATGDLIIIMDSHMRPHYTWLNQIVQAHHTHPNDILCTESVSFYADTGDTFYGRGAEFRDNHENHGFHTGQWCMWEHLEPGPYPRIHMTHGACYVFPRYQYQQIGGYAPLQRGWGYEEEWVAFRAAAMGIETRLISGCPIQHQYKRQLHRRSADKDDRPQGWEPIFNRHVVAIGMFGFSVWSKHYRNRIINGTSPSMRPFVMQQLHRDHHIISKWREAWKPKSLRPEVWMPRVNIKHPDPVQLDDIGNTNAAGNTTVTHVEGAITPDPSLISRVQASHNAQRQGKLNKCAPMTDFKLSR